ncbi:MFS transporter [Pseudonocardia sp. KRD291]|uniref:MFS transporter n=1 Tax=Pseudonocardia sp. KRD291 TaxID=2792007 RepID=UPI001C4A097F|nr:MFS transporter [Pseudonocardia sp. KRD291]MBW0101761.1 MFS transporter [Pseudonocardia sp. KRD291]
MTHTTPPTPTPPVPAGTTSTTAPRQAPRWLAMSGLAASLFLVVLDAAMANLAGPSIREGLDLTAAQLAVVVNSYLVAFAGLLLLGGRLADTLGGRTVFLSGLGIYLTASIVCALAGGVEVLVAGRILQGIGAAVVTPAALSLVLRLYTSAGERTRAMGIWGAVTGFASLLGVFLGGAVTQVLGWQAVFWAPVPIGLLAAVVVWRTAPRTRARRGRFDLTGAALITAGISSLALSMLSAPESGWTSPTTLGGVVVGLACMVAFVVVERRSAQPLVPLGVFRRKPVVVANLVMLLVGGTVTSLFFFLPQFQQQVLGMSPLTAGLSQLPIAVMIIVGSAVAPLLAKLLGLSRAVPTGLAVLLAGLLWLATDPTTGAFSLTLLGAFLLIGVGLGLGLVNATALALRDTGDGEGGLLSGLINATQQLGGAIGLAALAGLAIGAAGAGTDVSFTTAFLGAAALVLLALVVSLVPTSDRDPAPAGAQAP